MAQAMTTGAGWTLTMGCEPIEVTTLPHDMIDPEWRYVDKHGHEHTEASFGRTTRPVWRRYYDPDDGWIEYIAKHVCRRCKNRVRPAMVLDPKSMFRQFMPGPIHAVLCVGDRSWVLSPDAIRRLQAMTFDERQAMYVEGFDPMTLLDAECLADLSS